ncbi:hypothetical protein, partial [Klebsiella pneumoniae]|uniref:hypothetical protein n=1 Tax=Klebsiella pneumoniae TaxID=573 RepID=UPI0034E01392
MWYSPSLRNRVTMSIDTSRNQFSLMVTAVTAADTAVYYCAAEMGVAVAGESDWFDPWGQGTPVTVSSASTTGPSVFP